MDRPAEPLPRTLLTRRLPRRHLAGAALAGVAGFGGVVALACLIGADAAGLDGEVVAGLHDHGRSNPGLVAAGLAVTALGSGWAIGAIALAAGVVMVRRWRFDLLACWLIGLTGGGVLVDLLKRYFRRPRPVFTDPFAVESSAGFPSGHALGAVVCFGLLAYFALLVGRSRRAGLAAVGVALVLVLSIGVSRLYLGVHYPTDVLAGYAAGVGWLAVWVGSWEAVRRARIARDRVAVDVADGREDRA